MRTTRSVLRMKDDRSYMTFIMSQRSFESSWSHPDVPVTTPTLADLGVLYGGRARLLRVAEIAEQLGVSPATVYKLCASGALPHVRIVDSIRVRPADLAAFVVKRSEAPTSDGSTS